MDYARTGRRLRAVAAAGVLALALAGCGGGSGAPADAAGGGKGGTADKRPDRVEPVAATAQPDLPTTVRSADGRKVTVRKADRIVPLTGSISELVYSLGLGKRVVARDITATFEQAKKLPVVTHGHDVSAESVLSLKPDVVLAETTTGPEEAISQIRAAGIPVVVIDPAKELTDVGKRIDAVAGTLGVTDNGKKLRTRSEDRIAAAQRKIPEHKGDKPRVAFLYLRGTASVYMLGGADSGAASLIEAAGGIDAGKESGLEKDFTPITSEALAKAAPDVILVMTKGLESVDGVDGLLKIPGIAQTPAGQQRRVASIDDGVLLSYGPRTDEVLTDLVAQLHKGR
ncbi:ABC transporter substrate-binding protein [Streptomyces sp. A7024]|uniref:ABC transporter substrate-binding protein n=1 Tax=Streptomyces coryli TaxID=1128680 RepID=A0A6G4TZ09_9ACTN|nr:ABC transporter substrate-binding protein [Streptomyces coryli]NGN64267.1 ABC transporter substrate-binding protein [Streptomyces coryli]